jgi:hypothetical protein
MNWVGKIQLLLSNHVGFAGCDIATTSLKPPKKLQHRIISR